MGMETNEKIKRYRKMAKITQAQLAEKCGMHISEVSVYERGVRNPTLTTIERFAKALGIPPMRLLPDWVFDRSDCVPVVRCKDCAWCHQIEDLNYCENPNTPWISDPEFDDVTVADNDFCTYGERREGE